MQKTQRRFLQSVVERQTKETFCFLEQWVYGQLNLRVLTTP